MEWNTDLAEDILQPELKPTEQEAVTFDSSQTELTEVEAGEIERAAADEQVLSGRTVNVTATVETT